MIGREFRILKPHIFAKTLTVFCLKHLALLLSRNRKAPTCLLSKENDPTFNIASLMVIFFSERLSLSTVQLGCQRSPHFLLLLYLRPLFLLAVRSWVFNHTASLASSQLEFWLVRSDPVIETWESTTYSQSSNVQSRSLFWTVLYMFVQLWHLRFPSLCFAT